MWFSAVSLINYELPHHEQPGGKVKTALVSLMALAMLTVRGQDLAGHYILQGVMEVGSQLLLKSDGSFEYVLSYGAADYWAKGTWYREGDTVVLNSAI